MQLLIEFLPLAAFLGGFLYKDIYFALIVLMIAMPITLGIKYLRTRKVEKLYLWSTIFLIVFGALTLYFRNPKFLYWKPTAFSWVVGAAFLASQWIGDKPLVRRILEATGEFPNNALSTAQWRNLNLAWVVFWFATGAANIYVAYNFSEAVWVNFKVFGLLALTFVFMLLQGLWLFRHLDQGETRAED